MAEDDDDAWLTPAVDECAWEVRDRSRITWRHWGDEVVVYSGWDGATHLLDADGGATLLLLLRAGRPVTLTELGNELAVAGAAADEGRARALKNLEALQHIHLIARRGP